MKNPNRERRNKMTRKDFQQVAEIIRKRAEQDRQEFGNQYHGIIAELAEDFILMFRSANPKFDVVKFYLACGMDEDGRWVI